MGAQTAAPMASPATADTTLLMGAEKPQAPRAPQVKAMARAHAGSGSYRSSSRGTVM